MSWYTCKRCEYISKQKEVMKRHLEKQKKCIIINLDNKLSELELYNLSLTKNNYYDVLSNDKIKNYCYNCNKKFSNTYCYNRHLKNNICSNNECDNDNNEDIIETKKEEYINIKNDKNIESNTINLTNINNSIININFNLNSLKGFDEKWDVSKIDKYQMVGLLFSNNKFSNTLEKILENKNNLNVIINNESGIVYKSENDTYEPISRNDLFKQTLNKLYDHLTEFYDEICNDCETNKYYGKNEFLNNEMKKISDNYEKYNYKKQDFKLKADEALNFFYNKVKEDAEKKFIEINEEKTKNIGF